MGVERKKLKKYSKGFKLSAEEDVTVGLVYQFLDVVGIIRIFS